MLMTLALIAAAQTPAAEAAPAADKKICRRDTGTSSRLDVKKVCKTAAEWAAYHRSTEHQQNRRQDLTGTVGQQGR